jgi:fatty-acyl-CoA synthase
MLNPKSKGNNRHGQLPGIAGANMAAPLTAHLRHWPHAAPHSLSLPCTSVFDNLASSAARYPDKPAIVFYDSALSYAGLKAEADALAGHLQKTCGVARGDRVLLMMQNSPQWAIAFFAILRAGAVVVPVNPMNRTDELRHYVDDTGATVAFVAQDLLAQLLPLHRLCAKGGLQHLVVATYRDHLSARTDLRVPEFVASSRDVPVVPGVVAWTDARSAAPQPVPVAIGPGDPCVMPYTSGTTGAPKGCVHTHHSVMRSLVGGVVWFDRSPDTVYLSTLPFFHVTGLTGSLNGPLYLGGTLVILARWDREVAACCVERYRVDTWQSITAMMVDFLANPELGRYDLSSLKVARGVAQQCLRRWRGA